MKHGAKPNYAAVMDVQMKLRKEECAGSMGQKPNFAAVMDAQIKFGKEECVLGMEQRGNYAAVKDAQIKLRKEECAGGMGRTAYEESTAFDHPSSKFSCQFNYWSESVDTII